MDAIVAVYSDWGIGERGTQPVVLHADRAHFREKTKGAAVIVGRKTMEDFPGGKPLRGRNNIVVTRQALEIEGAEIANSTEEALSLAAKYEKCYVIGGASVFRQFFPYLDRVELTKIDLAPPSDSFFPDLDADPGWFCAAEGPWQEEAGIRFRFCTYERRSKKDRMEEKLREYARLLVEIGVNIQKGQTLVISSPVDCAGFARLCVEAAYAAGAREVVMRWGDDAIARQRFLYAADELFDSVPEWNRVMMNGLAEQGAAFLSIIGNDPEAFLGVDPERMLRSSRASGRDLAPFRSRLMANRNAWSIGAIPVPSWAKKVFPACGEDEAMEKLWDAIFKSVRITGAGDAVENWRRHIETLRSHVEQMNAWHFETLRYRNSLGTDLTIRLPEEHLWAGGSGATGEGQVFIANMPTEEIFTAPLRDGVDGVVCASMPLVHNGNVIEGIRFTVRDGKIVQAHADRDEELLKTAISVDEGASRFGEVALVPYDSPIRSQEILFYDTLFDENAACHLAFGDAYPECVRGGEEMSPEELAAAGLNHSDTHVDFMIGTRDLSIVGRQADGTEIEIFRDGNFTF
ncbi:MAG: aminopeptidase [Oscillospiraceae bacterium]|nr:aminopeptidase [Oscillospiraceae bacterium]